MMMCARFEMARFSLRATKATNEELEKLHLIFFSFLISLSDDLWILDLATCNTKRATTPCLL
jgi:hypothetical protein